jgi:dihydroxyacetone kinase
MTSLTLTLLAAGAASALILAPMAAANAQSMTPASAPMAAPEHGSYTLKERESWLHERLDKARSDGAIDHGEYSRVKDELGSIQNTEDRMRDHHDGQLTDNQTAMLEGRLDAVAEKIHWLHEDSFQRPW